MRFVHSTPSCAAMECLQVPPSKITQVANRYLAVPLPGGLECSVRVRGQGEGNRSTQRRCHGVSMALGW